MTDDLDMDIKGMTSWLLVLVVLIVIFLSFLEKRKSRQNICCGRPALIIPFRFLDGYENRVAYAMAFGTTTNMVVSLITSQQTIVYFSALAMKALDVYLQAMLGCLTCFPLFACLTTRYRALGAVICILYSLCWLAINVLQTFQSVTGNSTSSLLGVNIAGLNSTVQPHQEEHVRWVLRKFQLKKSPKSGSTTHESVEKNLSSQTFVEQMRSSIKLRHFTNLPFFKYPTRIIAMACIQLNVLYWYSLLLLAGTTTILYMMIHAEFAKQLSNKFALDLLIIISVCCGIAVVFSVANALVQIFIGFRNYRLDMLCIYQRHRTFIPVRNETSQYILTRSMTFPGFQIAFMMWGIVVCFAAMLLMTLIPVLLIYLFIQLEILDDIAWQAFQLLRKLYELLNYYSMFTNMAVGIFACLWRIAESAIIGTFSVGRLDRSVFTRENETSDRGYAAYTSMLLVDNAHNNPCMRVFAHLLWTQILAARSKQCPSQMEMSEHTVLNVKDSMRYNSTENFNIPETPTIPETKGDPWTFCEITATGRTKKAETRWYLAYTLINNPQLCKLRKQRLARTLCKTPSVLTEFFLNL